MPPRNSRNTTKTKSTSSPPAAAASSSSAAYKVGDLVWASPDWDESIKEPASVLKVGCEYKKAAETGGDDSNSSDGDGEDVICHDGILVKFQVSVRRKILPPNALSPYQEEPDEEENEAEAGDTGTTSTTNRRSARRTKTKTSNLSPHPSTVVKTAACAGEESNRSLVTPSPPTTNTSAAAAMAEEAGERDLNEEDPMDVDDEEEEEEGEEETPANRRGRSAASAPPQKKKKKKKKEEKKVATDHEMMFCAPTNGGAPPPPSPVRKEEDHEDEKENTTSISKKRGRSRSTTSRKTTSNTTAQKKKSTNDDSSDQDEDDEEEEEQEDEEKAESPYFQKKKAKTNTNGDKEEEEEEDSDDEEDVPLASLKKPAGTTKKKKAPVAKKTTTTAPSRKKKAGTAATTTKKAASKKTTKEKKVKAATTNLIVINESDDDDEPGTDLGSDSEDDEDKPFQAEYATTGRATCKRCDELITKGTLRVSHVPLFRGKPGFRVYRHLQCIVFSDQVQCVQDIGGWKTIKKNSRKDFERLTLRVEESKIDREKENEELQPDELVQVTFQGEIRKSPPGLTANLLPFQVEGVSWMYHQETQLPDLHGGILADEMGMGKTLQTITTILDNRPMLQHSKPGAKHPPSLDGKALEARKRESALWDQSVGEWTHEMNMNNIPKRMWPKKQNQAARAGTLVICPVIALTQWKAELEKFTAPGTFSIATYHGPNRAKEYPIQKLIKYDIVLTTYQVLEADFRKMVSPNKVTCPNCGGKFKADKLRVHLTYFCGEGAQRTEAQARQQRTADRPNRGGGGRGGGGGKGPQKKKSFSDKKPPMTTTKAKQKRTPTTKKKAPAKKRGAKKEESSDFEEEDSVKEVETTPSGRPSRSAAKAATSRMSSSKSEWFSGAKGGNSDDESFSSDQDESDDEDDEDSVMSYDEEDSDGEAIPNKKVPKKKVQRKLSGKRKAPPRKKRNDSDDSDGSDSESSSEEEDGPLARARKRQQAALDQAKKAKGKKTFSKDQGKSKAKAAGKRKVKAKGKGKGKKKFDDEDYSSHPSSSSDESSDDEHEGPNRDPLAGIDLEELMKEAMEGSQMSLLHSVCWWRVVLDEAHMIKSRSSQTAAAAFALVGVNRWALSGTPLQNRVGELYSLIRFIRIDPMAHYFCRAKGCDCKSIHYRIKHGTCLDCKHRGFQHYSHFNKHVLNPIQRDGYSGDGRRAMSC